jgi:hypothetical protein
VTFQQGVSSSGIPSWGADNISQPRDAERRVRGRDSPVVQNLTLPLLEIIFLGGSGSDTPPQRGGGSRKPVDEGDIKSVLFKVDRLHLAWSECLEMPEGRLKSQGGAR